MRPAPSRVAVPLAAGLLGFLVVLAASQESAPARGARRLELVDLIQDQDARVRALQRQAAALRADIERMAAEAASRDAGDVRAQVHELVAVAGGGTLSGPGVAVTLDDSSATRSPSGDPNDLVVHERDIQLVVNALWAAGAESVAINGERLSSMSAVRCAGNTLLLHGAVHSPPYRIEAIGDAASLRERVERAPGMERLAAAARTFGLRFDVREAAVRIGGEAPVLALAVPEVAA